MRDRLDDKISALGPAASGKCAAVRIIFSVTIFITSVSFIDSNAGNVILLLAFQAT